jgi:hypothetical protein
MKAERSSAKEEDGEFMHEKANEERYPGPQGFVHLPTPPVLGKLACATPGSATLFAAMGQTTYQRAWVKPPVTLEGT